MASVAVYRSTMDRRPWSAEELGASEISASEDRRGATGRKRGPRGPHQRQTMAAGQRMQDGGGEGRQWLVVFIGIKFHLERRVDGVGSCSAADG
jgi:hypothetical protein